MHSGNLHRRECIQKINLSVNVLHCCDTYGHLVWSSCMVIMYGHHVWSSYMVIMYGHHVWSSCMVIIYGHHIWSSCMVILHGKHDHLVQLLCKYLFKL